MKFSKHSMRSFVALAFAALAWLSPLPALAGDNVWTSDGSPGPNITGIALDPADPRTIYAVSGSLGIGWIFKSVDGGANWREVGRGDPALYGLTCLAVDPANPSDVYAGTSYGIVANSHDAGATWSKVTVGTGISSIAVEPATGSVYAATASVTGTPLWRSIDGGNSWFSAGLPRSNNKPRRVYALLADAFNQTLVAGTHFAYAIGGYLSGPAGWYGAGVARTTNAGKIWTMAAANLGSKSRGIFSSPVTALAADPLGGFVYAAVSGHIFRSGDAGATWIQLSALPYKVETIVVDPSAASTLYAGGSSRIWRSSDGGATWRPFDSGLGSRYYTRSTSLAIDPTGRRLYVATADGLLHREIPVVVAATGPCEPGADHLCLLGSRFRVDLRAIDPRTQSPATAEAIAQADRFGYFSFPTLTGDSSLPEVFVKMLDATSLQGQGFWLFSAALTDVPYSLAVTDTATGQTELYDGQGLCGTADTQSFRPDVPSPVGASALGSSAALEASGVELALLSHRFRITLSATDPSTGTTVAGAAIPRGDRFGYFSLPALTGDASFPEVFVKMLDATSLPDGDFWLFQAGVTTLPYTLTVTDSVTGAVKTYQNDPSDPTRLCGSADTHVTTGTAASVLTGAAR